MKRRPDPEPALYEASTSGRYPSKWTIRRSSSAAPIITFPDGVCAEALMPAGASTFLTMVRPVCRISCISPYAPAGDLTDGLKLLSTRMTP